MRFTGYASITLHSLVANPYIFVVLLLQNVHNITDKALKIQAFT